MKKILPLFILTAIAGGVIMSNAAEKKTEIVKYRSAFDIKYAFCSIKTNGLVGQDNHDSVISGRGFGTASTAAMIALENGENEISVEFGGLNWFNPEIKDEKEKGKFNPEAYCNLEFVKIEGAKFDVLDTISVAIDKDGKPYAKESDVFMQVRNEKGVISGHIPEIAYKPSNYPNMSRYHFKKKVVVNGLPEWAWIKAEEYKDTPEQRAKLEQAYQALWDDFNQKNLRAIKLKHRIALQAWAYATDSTSDEIFKDWEIDEDIKQGYRMLPINWDSYDVNIMNKGRMVRLINKSNPDYSPITQIFESGTAYYAPIFSLINGEFVIVL